MTSFETFAASVIVAPDKDPYVGKGRHDEVVKQAKKLKGGAVEAIVLDKAFYAQVEADAEAPGANYQLILYRLLAELRKGSFTLETPTKE
jgi:hypothetical protein